MFYKTTQNRNLPGKYFQVEKNPTESRLNWCASPWGY